MPRDRASAADDSPLGLARLLVGRDNPAREAAVAGYLERRGIAHSAHRFETPEGAGLNLSVEVGHGDRILVLCAHHDAVPGSPGANDNAAAVGILLHSIPSLARRVPDGWRVRLLFTAAEELNYLGARCYVADTPLTGIAGVLSLELCGRGDAIALWDAEDDSAFLRQVTGAIEGLGLARDRDYHVVGGVPLFGSDHRAFAAAGVPAYGFTVAPRAHADTLRRLVTSPMHSAVVMLADPPPPFDTYHRSDDALGTLEPAALELATRSIAAIVAALA